MGEKEKDRLSRKWRCHNERENEFHKIKDAGDGEAFLIPKLALPVSKGQPFCSSLLTFVLFVCLYSELETSCLLILAIDLEFVVEPQPNGVLQRKEEETSHTQAASN